MARGGREEYGSLGWKKLRRVARGRSRTICEQQQFTANGKLKQDWAWQLSSSELGIIGGGARES